MWNMSRRVLVILTLIVSASLNPIGILCERDEYFDHSSAMCRMCSQIESYCQELIKPCEMFRDAQIVDRCHGQGAQSADDRARTYSTTEFTLMSTFTPSTHGYSSTTALPRVRASATVVSCDTFVFVAVSAVSLLHSWNRVFYASQMNNR